MRKNVLTSEEIKEIIDNLYRTIGVRMDVNLSNYPNINVSLSNNNFMDACKVITDQMELPISIMPLFSSSFHTQGMVLNEGNSTSGVAAQIHIPANLPWYKTDGMKNFPINITVPPEALSQGHYYLLTQLSHEFSHIYLHSRRDPQKDSEWATDLCALMMGFTPLWLQGRKHVSKEVNSNQTITYTQTQGYLSDAEFNFAVDYIDDLRSPFEQLRNSISFIKQQIQESCNDISKYLEDVSLLYDFHYKHPQTSFKNEKDAAVFSKLAQPQYKSEIEALLTKSKNETNAIIKPLQNKKEFYEKDRISMENHGKDLNAIEAKLGQCLKELKHYYDVLIQNLDVKHYTSVFNVRVKSMSKGIRNANKKTQQINKKIEILEKCLAHYKKYKKKSYAKDADAKTFSLIGNTDYIASSVAFIKNKQEKIDEIDGILKKTHYFYSIDEERLLSKIAELNDVISTLDYCQKEQNSHIKVVKRNLNFIGRTKWILKNSFALHSA